MRHKGRKALITGFTGQDGRYLAEYLLALGYEVSGMIRRVSHPNWDFITEMGLESVNLVQGDLADIHSLRGIIKEGQFDEIYNLGAMSHVAVSFKQPEYTADITGLGPLRLLELIREYSPKTRFYQGSSSEQMGKMSDDQVQNELTNFKPQSPYAAAKLFAHNMCRIYRESYNIFASCGILYNHESPHRSVDFVTRKITDYIGKVVNGLTSKPLSLGNLDARRDWSFAGDMVRAMYLILQQDKPEDYVIASGETHSVREFVELAFARVGIHIEWLGNGPDQIGQDSFTKKTLIKINSEFYRPAEVPFLLGDPTKAKEKLGWSPSISFKELVNMMVDYDNTKYQTNQQETPWTTYKQPKFPCI